VAEFVFATCLPGLEPAVKREVARTRPALKFAYSRPGLITFKSPSEIRPGDPPGSAFARVWGRSLGAARDLELARSLLGDQDRIHVFAREPEEAVPADWATLATGDAHIGERVGDVIVDAEGAWIGAHVHDRTRSPFAGGGVQATLPDDSPSRAYAKIEEAIAFGSLPFAAKQTVVEIGAAPGGAVMALARRGLTVVAVDPGELAPQVLALPGVTHLPIKVGALRWEQLPDRVDWLLLDVNLAPQVALHEIARLMPKLRDTLRGAVLTLKLNDWSFVDELPKLVDRIHQLGFADVRLRHLPSNRREICAIALKSA
jgi:23S rRNA (cytidine2498-2'-O)-methyltransferase